MLKVTKFHYKLRFVNYHKLESALRAEDDYNAHCLRYQSGVDDGGPESQDYPRYGAGRESGSGRHREEVEKSDCNSKQNEETEFLKFEESGVMISVILRGIDI